MRTAALLTLCLLAAQPSQAADQPFIPPELNRILPQIRSGMSVPNVEAILRASYPDMTPQVGDWSGGGGTIVYRLDEQYTVAIYCEEIGNVRLVHHDVRFILYERPANRRITLSLYEWKD
jgi:hypothetical protein